MDSFGILWGGVFLQVHYSEEYFLFSTNSNPNPNIVIVIPGPPGAGPAASPLPAWQPQRPHGGVGYRSGASNNRDPVDVMGVVVSVVIAVVTAPKTDIERRLW